MLIEFTATGEIVDTAVATPQSGPVVGPYVPLILAHNYGADFTDPTTGLGGSTPVEGQENGTGSRLFSLGQGGAYITFYGGASRTLIVTKFKMDDAAAVTTGIGCIATAIAAGDDYLYLNSDGTCVSS